MKNTNTENLYGNDKEDNIMTSVKLIEYDKVDYIKRMSDYLNDLKNMKKSDAKKVAHTNLFESNIVDENGEFTERYKFTREISLKKR